MKTLHLKIFGRVQGVGFRFSCQETAEKLGICGWVRNSPDNSVEILAQGNEDSLRQFLDWCYNWQGGTIPNGTERTNYTKFNWEQGIGRRVEHITEISPSKNEIYKNFEIIT